MISLQTFEKISERNISRGCVAKRQEFFCPIFFYYLYQKKKSFFILKHEMQINILSLLVVRSFFSELLNLKMNKTTNN